MRLWDRLWIDADLATMTSSPTPYGAVPDGAVAVEADRIVWIGRREDLPGAPADLAAEVRSCHGGWITPGLIDCHTHLVFAGHRAKEFELRLGGATYEEIARDGGGILSTVRATREASEDELAVDVRGRLECLLSEGVTTVEIKSGYGLEVESELKMLRVARRVGRELPVDVRATLLGAHALPPEYLARRDDYVELVVGEMLDAALEEGLVDAVDAFLEEIAFTVEEVATVFRAAADRGLPVRLHADQRTDGGGAGLAAAHGALSADHLEFASEAGIRAMAEAATVAVLLPGAFYTLRETRRPPVETFRREGVVMALATDANPGTSPLLSLLLSLNLGCTLFGLTPEEALAGVTRNAAQALGLGDDRGTLEVGKRADLAIWKVSDLAELSYWIGSNPLLERVKDGQVSPSSF